MSRPFPSQSKRKRFTREVQNLSKSPWYTYYLYLYSLTLPCSRLHQILEKKLGVKKRKAKEIVKGEEDGSKSSAASSVLKEVRHSLIAPSLSSVYPLSLTRVRSLLLAIVLTAFLPKSSRICMQLCVDQSVGVRFIRSFVRLIVDS